MPDEVAAVVAGEMEDVDAAGALCAATGGADDIASSFCSDAEVAGVAEAANGVLDEAWSVAGAEGAPCDAGS